MLERKLEPELMDDPEESQAYDDMDHSAVNRQFVIDFLDSGPAGDEVLDLGTGTARIPIELCRQEQDCRIIASDAAVSMLEVAKINVAIEGFEHRIQLHHGDSKDLQFDDSLFDSVISNSLIHHVPKPEVVLAEMVRVVRPGGRLFVRDLMRPETLEEVERFVAAYSGQENKENQQLFRQSLIAALSLIEIRGMIEDAGFDAAGVQATSDRHWTWVARKPQ